MLNSNERIIKHKLGLLNLAEELGNVSQAFKVMGLSRDTFYRYKAAVDKHSLSGGLVQQGSQVLYFLFANHAHHQRSERQSQQTQKQ